MNIRKGGWGRGKDKEGKGEGNGKQREDGGGDSWVKEKRGREIIVTMYKINGSREKGVSGY